MKKQYRIHTKDKELWLFNDSELVRIVPQYKPSYIEALEEQGYEYVDSMLWCRFRVGDPVYITRNGTTYNGTVVKVHPIEEDIVLYDVQFDNKELSFWSFQIGKFVYGAVPRVSDTIVLANGRKAKILYIEEDKYGKWFWVTDGTYFNVIRELNYGDGWYYGFEENLER